MMNEQPTNPRGRYIVGIDVGGTHTDIELVDIDSGRVYQHKILSTPDMPSRAIRVGTAEIIAQSGVDPAQIIYFANGTTVATNAVVQKRTAVTGLITTKGFRDLLEIRRQRQPDVYNIHVAKPAPPALRRHRREVDERKYLFGRDDIEPREDELVGVAQDLVRDGVNAIAVCFLNSYVDATHELKVKAWLAKHLPDVYVCTSAEVLPEFREYERTSTTVLNASLGPVMKTYLENIVGDARDNGLVVEPKILQSNGGVASPSDASLYPVRTLASGPAAGVIGAVKVALDLGEPNVITFDVGGTTADICLVENGEPLFAVERDVAGYPVRFPMVDVLSIGAGGGSIAWLDAGGFLHVGPQSAGAAPGPVCYGRGGTEPTVTDANLVLGRLNPSGLLGGRVPVDRNAARGAIRDKIATKMGMTVEEAAVGILTILTENMVQGVRVTSVERGHDPREFSLLAFGGGGPLLAAQLAAELGMRRVIIPRSPGLLCAEGLLVADTRADFSKTRIMALCPESASLVAEVLNDLDGSAKAWFDKEGISTERRSTTFAIDMRYRGQSHELRVPMRNEIGSVAMISNLREAFVAMHRRLYSFAPNDDMELVTFRVVASARTFSYPRQPIRRTAATVAIAHRDVYFEESGRYESCPVYDRTTLGEGTEIAGPAVIEQMDTTTIVRPAQSIRVHAYGEMILTLNAVEASCQ